MLFTILNNCFLMEYILKPNLFSISAPVFTVTRCFRNILGFADLLICCSGNLSYYQCWNGCATSYFCDYYYFFFSGFLKKKLLFEVEHFCNIVNVFCIVLLWIILLYSNWILALLSLKKLTLYFWMVVHNGVIKNMYFGILASSLWLKLVPIFK